ncbi:MAG TPA: diaminopimelate epimerase [Bacteroidales bacterium]|nr:diaminopimelate epimerase [Bacteroidales bacterium]
MALTFYKFHGAGNDFVLFDNRNGHFGRVSTDTQKLIRYLCDRHMGIGADGVILLGNSGDADFAMEYYNSDGNPGSFCGNGGRCIVAFAHALNLVNEKVFFLASDGYHEALINHFESNHWDISLKMKDVSDFYGSKKEYCLNTGSPHLVLFSKSVSDKDIVREGRKIRYSARFAPDGINVNFAEVLADNRIRMRTYERGVENETMACGTGATAVALAAWKSGVRSQQNSYKLIANGGELRVSFEPPNTETGFFSNIWLSGQVVLVFKGNLLINVDNITQNTTS